MIPMWARGSYFSTTPGGAYDPSSDTNLVAWYRENVTDTGGDSTADEWLDKTGNGYTGVLDGAAVAAPISGSDPDFNNHQSLQIGSGGPWFFNVAGSSPSDWNFLHNGSGSYGAVAFHSTATDNLQTLLSTADRDQPHIGLYVRYNGSDENVEFVLCDGTGTFNVLDSSTAGGVALNATHWLAFRMKTGKANEYEVYVDGTRVLNGTFSSTPTSDNASNELSLGADQKPIYNRLFQGKIAEIFVGQGYPDLKNINDYGTDRYT